MTENPFAKFLVDGASIVPGARVPVPVDPARQAELEAAEMRAWKERLRKYAPIAEWEAAWEPRQEPGVKVVQDWLAKGCERHLCLFGGIGCGKSTAAAVAVKHWVRSSFPAPSVVWLKPNQLVSAVLHDYDEKSPKLAKHIVIDDMGRNEKPEFSDALCDLLDRQGHVLIITSNLTSRQFSERYIDPRFVDRLNHTAMSVRLPGESLRRRDGGF